MNGVLAITAFILVITGGVQSARIDHSEDAYVEGENDYAVQVNRNLANVSGSGAVDNHVAFFIPNFVFSHLLDVDDWTWGAGANAALGAVGLNLAGQTYLEASIAFGLFAGQFSSIRARMDSIGKSDQLADQWYMGLPFTVQQHVRNDQEVMERVADMAYTYYEAAKIKKDIPQQLFVKHQHEMQVGVDARLPVLKQHLESISNANPNPTLALLVRKALTVAGIDIQLQNRESITLMMEAIEANTDAPLRINVLEMNTSNPWGALQFTHLSGTDSLNPPSKNGGPFRINTKLEKWTMRNRWTLNVGQGEAGQSNTAVWLLWSDKGTTADQLSIDGGSNWLKWSGWCGPLGSFVSADLRTIVEVSPLGSQ